MFQLSLAHQTASIPQSYKLVEIVLYELYDNRRPLKTNKLMPHRVEDTKIQIFDLLKRFSLELRLP